MGNTKRRISQRHIWRRHILIFVSTGSRKFQFDRLIKQVDYLAEQGLIEEKVFAQIAETTYIPKYIEYKRYLSPEEFSGIQENADLIITHAGTGALIGALKKGKQVIAVPRLFKYGEHSDDHQLQVAEALENEGYLRVVMDMDELYETIIKCKTEPITKIYNKPSNVLPIIENQIMKWFEE